MVCESSEACLNDFQKEMNREPSLRQQERTLAPSTDLGHAATHVMPSSLVTASLGAARDPVGSICFFGPRSSACSHRWAKGSSSPAHLHALPLARMSHMAHPCPKAAGKCSPQLRNTTLWEEQAWGEQPAVPSTVQGHSSSHTTQVPLPSPSPRS